MPGLETSLCWRLGLVVDLLESFSVSGFAEQEQEQKEIFRILISGGAIYFTMLSLRIMVTPWGKYKWSKLLRLK